MTLYAGETVQVTTTATGLDGTTALTDDDVVSVVIEIRDSALELVVEETEMEWDPVGDEDGPFWFYDWPTVTGGATPVAIEPATYKAKCTVLGAGTWTSFEYKRIRLARKAF